GNHNARLSRSLKGDPGRLPAGDRSLSAHGAAIGSSDHGRERDVRTGRRPWWAGSLYGRTSRQRARGERSTGSDSIDERRGAALELPYENAVSRPTRGRR